MQSPDFLHRTNHLVFYAIEEHTLQGILIQGDRSLTKNVIAHS